MVGLIYNYIHLVANPLFVDNKSLWTTHQKRNFLIHLFIDDPEKSKGRSGSGTDAGN